MNLFKIKIIFQNLIVNILLLKLSNLFERKDIDAD
jgi:hypothetical protein